MAITPEQLRAARDLLNWSIVKTAVRTNVGYTLIERFERGRRDLSPEIRAHLRGAFAAAGVMFTKSGARLKRPLE